MTAIRHLVLGGARSGKTRHALNVAAAWARSQDAEVVYVATAHAGDAEMQRRIARHREERPACWRTVEAPRQLAHALSILPSGSIVVVDCLTLWLSNALLQDFRDDQPVAELPTWRNERDALMAYLRDCGHRIVLVSNEVGSGIVPLAPVARRFQDEQGWLNQGIAGVCEQVTLVVAGLPISIKSG